MTLLEIHLLQSFVPELLNRDDTGSHKNCLFGGQLRARVSSQSWKRAMRDYVRTLELLPAEQRAVRSKRLHEALRNRLEEMGAEEADYVAEAALAYIGAFHIEKSVSDDETDPYTRRELKSEYLVFLGNDSLDAVADLLKVNWEDAKRAGKEVRKFREQLRKSEKYKGGLGDKGKETLKKAVDKALGKELLSEIEKAFDGSKAIDLALFGRMLADLPGKNVDGACQVAHALSTHAVAREYDYYTAVDDLKPDDTSGADMIGTIEFSSACYYRYAAIDLEKLRDTLGDTELVKAGLEAFLRAFVEAIPSGKQNSFAAQNPPSFGAFRVQDQAQPRNLANAFERPVRQDGSGFVFPSIRELDREWAWVDGAYGESGRVIYWLRFDEAAQHLKAKEKVAGTREAIRRAVEEAAKLLG
ncbi:MAG: type I-E CRISPR-associated protein Cas7/Cse4/CasC [Deinococcota bacterium]|jgi:CRISPR system Cascade subunit CasC|nr:type I-E CRISPR-associated protein Cas7/Cse4/CasC [Deinococcota bacterium]